MNAKDNHETTPMRDASTQPTSGADAPAWTRDEFEAQLRAKGTAYHIHHPFNVKMNSGGCSREQIRGWVANRFYYQINIPLKDAAIISNCPDRETRRRWVLRILDHDGYGDEEGGIEAWARLGDAVGLTRDELWSLEHVSPGVRFAVDAYVNFARRAPWQEAVCSSLTEMFAPQIHRDRLATLARALSVDRSRTASRISARASRSRSATSSTGSKSRSTISRDASSRNARSRSCSSSSTSCGRCSMPSKRPSHNERLTRTGDASRRHTLTIAKLFRLQWEPAQDAHVLLYPEGMVKLNQSAGEILLRCDGTRDMRHAHRRSGTGVQYAPGSAPRCARSSPMRDAARLAGVER